MYPDYDNLLRIYDTTTTDISVFRANPTAIDWGAPKINMFVPLDGYPINTKQYSDTEWGYFRYDNLPQAYLDEVTDLSGLVGHRCLIIGAFATILSKLSGESTFITIKNIEYSVNYRGLPKINVVINFTRELVNYENLT